MHLSFLIVIALFTVCVLLGVRYFFPKWGLLDRPQDYGHKRDAVPYPAGVIIPLVFFASAFALIPTDSGLYKPLLGFFCAASLLTLVSFLDDRFKLSPVLRLAIQVVSALIVVGFGIGINEIRSPFGENLLLTLGSFHVFGKTISPIADTLAVLWMVGMMNAMNWLDGVSGLTSSVSSIASFVLALTAFTFGQPDVAMLFAVLGVICLVFFLFDIETPKILMGDSGSMFLGLALAVFTIIAGGKLATAMLVMFVPLFDGVWTIGRRVLAGRSPFQGDLEHLHHHLLKLFPSRRVTVIVYAFFVAVFGFASYFLETQGKAILLGVLTLFLCGFEYFLMKHKK